MVRTGRPGSEADPERRVALRLELCSQIGLDLVGRFLLSCARRRTVARHEGGEREADKGEPTYKRMRQPQVAGVLPMSWDRSLQVGPARRHLV